MSHNIAAGVDLHLLYRERSVRKARAFLRSSSAGASSSSNAGGLSKSPNGGSNHWTTGAINAEVNRRDSLGRTVLHLAASELGEWALEWVEMMLSVAGMNVNAGDTESGWSALHR